MDTTSWFWPPGIECFNPAVADPGFPVWAPTLKVGAPTYYLANFPPECA